MSLTFSAPIHRTDLAAGVCILAPAPEPYRAAAERLRVTLEKSLAARVEVLPDEGAGVGGRHVVALGNAMDSAFLRTLYFRAYDLTDRAWPGPGGWVLRTIPRSLTGVGHVLVAGASRPEEIPDAVEALIGAVESPVLPFQHRVHLGRWADLHRKPAEERLAKGDADLEREYTAGAGDWPYMRAVGEIGMLAIQTGEGALMRMFCRQVCHFARTRWFERHLPDPPQIHGFLRSILLPFTLLENHPAIPGDLREQALGALLGLYRSTEGVANAGFLGQVGHDRVRQNHQTRSALDLYYGGRYFHQAHGLAEGLAWMRLSEIFYAPQMASNKPVCDSWGHQWSGSLCNTAEYALASGDVNGDGRDEILAGCADRHIYAFDDAGRLLWRSACQWGPPTCLSLARLENGDGMEVLAGLADPSIFGCVRVYGAHGTCVRTLSRPDLMCWSIPSWMKRLRVADLDGDGHEEVIAGVDTNHRQVIVYRRDGQILWEADVGSAALSVEVAGGRVYAGAANGFAQCFAPDGRRQWRRFLIEPVAGLAPDASGGCIAALRSGRVVGLDGVGEVRTSWEGASGVTASAWASPWPGGGLVVGRESGAVEYCVEEMHR